MVNIIVSGSHKLLTVGFSVFTTFSPRIDVINVWKNGRELRGFEV